MDKGREERDQDSSEKHIEDHPRSGSLLPARRFRPSPYFGRSPRSKESQKALVERGGVIRKKGKGSVVEYQHLANAGGQSLFLDILYTMGNNAGMKGQSAVINGLSRIKIRPQNHFGTLGMAKGDQA